MPAQKLKLLNARQQEAVEAIHGPLLIIAGAGSGKTRVITHRICYMVSQGIQQKHILALTFTNKAAKEMRERAGRLLGDNVNQATICTFHAFGMQILIKYGAHLGYDRSLTIYDQVDKQSLLKEVIREAGQEAADLDIFALGQLISAVKTDRVGLDGYDAIIGRIVEDYNDHLRVYNAVDFDDLITLPTRIFMERPDILAECRDRFRIIMVDEFQDTSIAQYRVVKLLAEQSRNLCVVGDDDQSIYSWRGANYENIQLFEGDFPERREIKLEQNYRSARDILEAANSVIANNTKRKEKNLWTGNRDVQSIELIFPENEIEEGAAIARGIRSHVMKDRLSYDEIGILVRTNGLMQRIEEALLADNLPYRVSGGTSFFQRKEIRDAICYLRVLANPDDNVSLLRIINTPRRGIGKTTLMRIRETGKAQSISLFSSISALVHAADSPLPAASREHLELFTQLILDFRERILRGKDMADVLNELFSAINYWGYLISEHRDKESVAKYKFSNVQRFIDTFKIWEHDPDTIEPSIYDYLNRISLTSRDDITDEYDKGKLNLMTIHAAKGLEFAVVFVAGVEDRFLPHARAIEDDPQNIEEERRLFYVALTRAKRKLILSSCRRRMIQREMVETNPSPFLEEIPQELIAVHRTDAPVEANEAQAFFKELRGRLGAE